MPVNLLPSDEVPTPAEGHNRRQVRQLVAALFSALIPGTGQLFLGQRRKGSILLVSLVILALCFWPFRLPRFYMAFVVLSVSYIALCLYAACSAVWASSLPRPHRPSRWWLAAVIPATLVALWLVGGGGTRLAGFRSFTIPSSSMEPTVRAGDQLVADMNYFDRRTPADSEVVIFHRNGTFFIKRVIAIGGETIEGSNGQIYVNGRLLQEPYVVHAGTTFSSPPWMNKFGPTPIPVGMLFVMGDNRDISLDSRAMYFGLVDIHTVVGKPLYILHSNRIGKAIN